MPTLLHNPYPLPGDRVAAWMEALIRERDGVHNAMVRLDFELVVEHEAKRAMEVRAKVSQQKVVEVEEAYQMAKDVVTELRGSLG